MATLNNFALFLVVLTSAGGASGIEFATGEWTGNGLYFLVDAEDAQARLDAIAASTIGAKQLYIPPEPIFPNIPEGKHVVYMDFGYESASDLSGQYTFYPTGPIVWVNIPYLSSTPGGDPTYHIPLLTYYTPPDEDPVQCGNVIFPFQVADELTITESSLYLRSHGEEMEIDFTISEPCQKPLRLYREETDTIVLRSSIPGGCHFPNVHFCNSSPYSDEESSYCCLMEDIRADVELNMPNVCTSYRSTDEGTCQSTIKETRITKEFRDVMLLGDGPITVIASEAFHGNYTINLEYPCI